MSILGSRAWRSATLMDCRLCWWWPPSPTRARPGPRTADVTTEVALRGFHHVALTVADRRGTGVNGLSLRDNAPGNGMPRFFRRLKMDVFDEEDVVFRTHELVHFLRETDRTEEFDFTQLLAAGYSNGANIAGGILMLYPELLAGAVLWHPMQPLIRTVPAFATTRHQPMLFYPGTHDPTVLHAASAQYAALLTVTSFALTRSDTEAGH